MGCSCARGRGACASSGCESDLGDGSPRRATSNLGSPWSSGWVLEPGSGVLGAGGDRGALVEEGTRPRSSRSSFLTGVRDLRVMSPQFFSVGGQTRVMWAVRGRNAQENATYQSPVAADEITPQPHPQSQILPPQDAPSPSQHPTTLQSGRQDLNLRPPGPQPGALPDCATPRGALRFYGQSSRGTRPTKSSPRRQCGAQPGKMHAEQPPH